MSKKIYLMIALLALVAIVITLVSVNAIRTLNNDAELLGFRTNRLVALLQMDTIIKNRTIGLLRIMVQEDPRRIAEIESSVFNPTLELMNTELQNYTSNTPAGAGREMQEYPVNIKKHWDLFVEETRKAVEMA